MADPSLSTDLVPFSVSPKTAIALSTLPDLASGGSFDDVFGEATSALGSVDFEGASGPKLSSADELSLSLQGGGALRRVSQTGFEAERGPLTGLALSGDQPYLVYTTNAEGAVKGEGTLKAITFGAAAGGKVGFLYARPFDPSAPALDVLKSFLKGLRLPHHAVSGGGGGVPATPPAPGEVLALEYGGYVQVSAGVGWGYDVSRSTDVKVGAMDLTTKARFAAKAGLTATAKVAGHWGIEVRSGHADGWVRIAVRKLAERSAAVAATLEVDASLDETEIPESARAVLEAALGIQTPDVVEQIVGDLTSPGAFVERIEKEVDGVLTRIAGEVESRLATALGDSPTATQVFEALQEMTAAYEALEKWSKEDPLALLERFAEETGVIEALLEAAEAAKTRLAFLDRVQDTAVWEALALFVGDRYDDVLTADGVYAEVRKRLLALKEQAWEKAAALIAARREALGLDALLKELDEKMETLKGFDTPQEVAKEAGDLLLDLMDKLTGRAFKTLEASELPAAMAELGKVVQNAQSFGDSLYEQFDKAFKETHKARIAASLAKTQKAGAFVDVEVNVLKGDGPELFKAALGGRFDTVFAADPSIRRIHPSTFTTETRTSSRLKVNLLGWEASSARDLILQKETKVAASQDGAAIFFHTLTGTDEAVTARANEEIKTRFVFQLAAGGKSREVVDTVSKMSASYSFAADDKVTSEAELRRYLRLAEAHGLFPVTEDHPDPVDAVLEGLKRDLGIVGSNWGAVSVQYRVRYAPDVLRQVFEKADLSSTSVQQLVRDVYRASVAAHAIRVGWEYSLRVAEAIVDPRNYRPDGFDRDGYLKPGPKPRVKTFPALDDRRVDLYQSERVLLFNLYSAEDQYVTALGNLDQTLDKIRSAAAPRSELEGVFGRFVKAGAKLQKETGMVEGGLGGLFGTRTYADPVFAILDRLCRAVSPSEARTSTLELTIHVKDEAIKRVYVSPG